MTLPKNPDRRQASNVVPLHPMLAEAQELIALGLDVIPLEPCSKITLVTGWTTAAPHTAESFAAALKPGGNIGLRTGRPVPGGGYLHVVDFDADAPTPEALAELHKLVPQAVLHRCPTVISGNASGARRHYYVIADEPLTKATRSGPWGKIELLGLGQQAVLPPSIHPESGRAYRWEISPIDMAELFDDPIAPTISAANCRAWGARRAEDGPPSDPLYTAWQRDEFADDLASGKLESALDAIGPDALDYDTYWRLGGALHYGSGGSDEAKYLWQGCVNRSYWYQAAATGEPIAGGPRVGEHAMLGKRKATAKSAERAQDKAWESYKPDPEKPPVTLATIYGLARAAGWTWEGGEPDAEDGAKDDDDGLGKGKGEDCTERKPRLVNVADWHGLPVPEREWLIQDWMPAGAVTALYGHGGTGKSFLGLQLGAAVLTGGEWCGRQVERTGKVLVLAAEDPEDELHRRLAGIADAFGHSLADYDGLHVCSLAELNAALAEDDRRSGKVKVTALYREAESWISEIRPELVVCDTLANLYVGDSIDQAKATQFIGYLRQWAAKYNCVVLLLAHPSQAGMASGTGEFGSVGWHNSVRSRLYLTRAKDIGDGKLRELRHVKANYGGEDSEPVILTWRRGAIVPGGAVVQAIGDEIRRLTLEMVDRFAGKPLNMTGGHAYAPRLFAEEIGGEKREVAQFRNELRSLIRLKAVVPCEVTLANRKPGKGLQRAWVARAEDDGTRGSILSALSPCALAALLRSSRCFGVALFPPYTPRVRERTRSSPRFTRERRIRTLSNHHGNLQR